MPPSPFVYEDCQDFHDTSMVLVLFCVAVTFLIFTACMMTEQIEAIQSGQGKIARMVGDHTIPRSFSPPLWLDKLIAKRITI